METADIFLGLVTLVVLMLGRFLNRLADTVDKLEQNINSCHNNMPLQYVLKDDLHRPTKRHKPGGPRII